jgi:hypothetical protein
MWTGTKRLFSVGGSPIGPPSGGRFGLFRALALIATVPVGYSIYSRPESVTELPGYLQSLVFGAPEKKTEPKQVPAPVIEPKKPVLKPDQSSRDRKVYSELLDKIEELEKIEEKQKEAEKNRLIAERKKREEIIEKENEEKEVQNVVKAEEIKESEVKKDESKQEVVKNEPVEPESVIKVEAKPEESKISEVSDPSLSQSTTKASVSSDEIKSLIETLRSDLLSEQQKRESELYDRLESSFSSLLSEFTPKTSSKETPAGILSSQIDFSKLTIDQIQKKYEELITAYQDRLESLGVRNYDSFIERLKMQKEKWKAKMEELQKHYESELQAKIIARDEQWRVKITEESSEAQTHYETQAKIDEDFVKQRTELDLTAKFKEELDEIMKTLENATNDRLKQLEDIMKKIKDMENVQEEHHKIILRLTDMHKIHVSIENLQRALLKDNGNLSKDLKIVVEEAKKSEFIKDSLKKFDSHYVELVEEGVPKLKQIQDRFSDASAKARRAALIKDADFFNILSSRVASWFIPRNIRTVDDENTFSLLKSAENSLDKGDLRSSLSSLSKLKGLPSEEMRSIQHDISLRLSLSELIEVLSAYSIFEVQRLINSKAL